MFDKGDTVILQCTYEIRTGVKKRTETALLNLKKRIGDCFFQVDMKTWSSKCFYDTRWLKDRIISHKLKSFEVR